MKSAVALAVSAVLASAVIHAGVDQPEPRSPATARIADGKGVFDRWCASCHGPDGMMAGTIALEARYQGTVPAALEQRTDLTAGFIEHFVRHGISVMPPFRKTEISDAQLRDLAAYLTAPLADRKESAP